jgi:2-polyprenyl-6-methoxyphenol hydroxylase-like FAD-dependent oxidoreductase
MMLGFLLARAGVETLVLEKHADFFRDFRGDTIHPSTMELMHELGLLEDFLKVPHQKVPLLKLQVDDKEIDGPDFTHLPVRCPFIALMPQWDFLNFLSARAKRFPGFQLRMGTEVTELIEEEGRIAGVRAMTDEGTLEVRADLVFGTDGRHSTTRDEARMKVRDFGVPIDVLWFRLRKPDHPLDFRLGRIRNGRALVTLDRGDYFQTAAIIPKGAFEEIKSQGLKAFQDHIASIVPEFSAVVRDLDDWVKVKLLTVQINRLERWARPGLLCIGDAAHAMSPAGGVGINLAIQDAVAAANLLSKKLLTRGCTAKDLAKVQSRREWPTKMTQRIQVFIHRRMFQGGPHSNKTFSFPWLVRLALRLLAPVLRRAAARVIGIGFRPEHVHSPEAAR